MEIFKIGVEIILIIIGVYLILFKSYIQEKGKNLATKDDIGKITEEIEKVKNEFLFQGQKKSDLFFERKKNLIQFYDSFFLWVDSALKVSDIILGHHKNPHILREAMNNIKRTNSDVLKFYSRLLVYLEDEEFLKTITSIYNETIIIHNSVFSFLITLEETSIRHLEIKDSMQNPISDKLTRIWENEHKEIVEKRNSAFEDYFKENEKLKKNLVKNKKLLVKTYKKRIFNEYAPISPNKLS